MKIAGEPDLPVEAGEIAIIPRDEEHLVGNGAPETAFDGAATLHRHIAGELNSLRWGGGGTAETIPVSGAWLDHLRSEDNCVADRVRAGKLLQHNWRLAL